MDGKVSTSQLLISIVTRTEAKDADRLRLRWAHGLISPVSWAANAAGVERAPKPILWHTRNVVSPSGSLGESDPQGKPLARWVGEDGKSERRPVMGRIGVAGGPTAPHAQAGRLPSGHPARESKANRLRRQSR